MLTLFAFAPAFGLPSPGPFAIKTEVQLQMLQLEYVKRTDGRAGAPKGKLPYIDDEGTVVADSTFIRRYLEHKHARDLDSILTPGQRADAWALERLAEDSLYWVMVHSRWAVEANFQKGPAHFFDSLPADVQDAARQKQRSAVLGYLHGQGIGRHNAEEIGYIARRGYESLARVLGDKPYFFGPQPCGTDASLFAQIVSAASTFFESPVRDAVTSHANLMDYGRRMMSAYFPAHA